MTAMSREIATQPECWREMASRHDEVEKFFGATGGRMALIGCGTSFHVAAAIARLREEAGRGGSDPFPASEVPAGRRYPWVLAVSRTGTTTEVIRALDAFDEGARRLVITADASSPLAGHADRLLVLDFADEESVVQTRFATTAIIALRTHLGHDVNTIASDGVTAVTADVPAEALSCEAAVFVGQGWAVPVAAEACLKMTEAAGLPCQSYAALELRHGPMSALAQTSLVWLIGQVDAALVGDVAVTGAAIAGGAHDPLVELLLVQRAAEERARQRGRDPDAPPWLGRSVVLA